MSVKLNNLKKAVEDVAEDLATLEVASFTNNTTTNLDLSGAIPAGGSEFKSKDLFKIIRTALTKSDLVGYSRFEIEGDTLNYLNSDLGEGKKYLTDGHNTLVEGAQKTRKDFFEFVLKAVKDI